MSTRPIIAMNNNSLSYETTSVIFKILNMTIGNNAYKHICIIINQLHFIKGCWKAFWEFKKFYNSLTICSICRIIYL